MSSSRDGTDRYAIERFSDGRIRRITIHGRAFGSGQEVVANGRYAVKDGTVGLIERIIEPFTVGHTTDVLLVQFDGEGGPFFVKPKDLRAEPEINLSLVDRHMTP